MNANSSKVIIGISIALALLTVVGIFAFGSLLGPREAEPLLALAWAQPMAQAFQILAAFAIAFLCFGRFRALGGAWVFWTGVAFLANGVLGIFYLLAWPGLIGEKGVIAQLPNTSGWFFSVTYSCIALLLAAVKTRRPDRLPPSWTFAGYALVAVWSALIGLLSVLYESALPATLVGFAFTPFAVGWSVVLVVAFALTAASSIRRYRTEGDVMLGYLALFLVLMAFGLLDSLIGGKRYVFLWYAARFIFVSAYTVLLFGFLQEGYALFSRERRRVEERTRLLREVEEFANLAQRRSAELAIANKELEAFTYSVAHDLRSPVRHMDGFSKALADRYAGKLDEEGQKYLRYMREGSVKMGQLIDDLLSLTGVTRREIIRTNVDLSQIAEEIATRLRKEQPERKVEFVIAQGVVVNGDPGLLRIAIDNLLGNAWKFTSKRERARIEFGVERQGNQPVYYVKDDGAGFDMAYADKLFRAFERLHDQKEFPGTGVGLATVERIVRRHGGKVWGEGEVDKGATFYFTLG